jgi:hypothetical protein
MLRLSVADLISARVPVSHAEAAALTVALADALADRNLAQVPADHRLFLSSTGHVSLWSVTSSTEMDVNDTRPRDATAQLAALMRRLLHLDQPSPRDRRRRVPGTLLVLLARAERQIDPPVELSDFRNALARFGIPDRTMLAALFWRAARARTSSSPGRPQVVALPPARVESTDRRRHTPPPEELRRYLREVERELYESRSHVARPPVSVEALIVRPSVEDMPPSVEDIPISQLPLPTRHQPRVPARLRALRITAAVAATIVGALMGTFAAFILSGALDVTPPPPASPTRSVVATMGVAPPPAPKADEGTRTIRTTRTVQPLLLAAAVGAEPFSPSFSPRGRTLLFHAGRKSAPLMRASMSDAGHVEQIEKLLDDGAANYHVTMSPDGRLIAYDSDRDGVRAIYVANADGTDPRRVSGPGHAAVPSWSPDGGRLAFVRAEPDQPRVWNIWIANVASRTLRRITRHPVGQPWGASWFPDGRRIAYSLEDRLMVADLSSGMATGYRSPRKGRLVRTPAVSPDGRRIVFQVQRDGVWLLDVERARMQRILTDATAEEFVWSPEGDAIAYHARSGGSYGLWRLALGSGGAN